MTFTSDRANKLGNTQTILEPEGKIGLQSYSIKNLMQQKLACQLLVRDVVKNKNNPHFNSNYSSLDTVVRNVRELYAKNGLDITQLTAPLEGETVLITQITHAESGEWIRGIVPLRVDESRGNSPSQKLGGAMTFMRRKCLLGMVFAAETDEEIPEDEEVIDSGDDDDNSNIEVQNVKDTVNTSATLKKDIRSMLDDLHVIDNGEDFEDWLEKTKLLRASADKANLRSMYLPNLTTKYKRLDDDNLINHENEER